MIGKRKDRGWGGAKVVMLTCPNKTPALQAKQSHAIKLSKAYIGVQ